MNPLNAATGFCVALILPFSALVTPPVMGLVLVDLDADGLRDFIVDSKGGPAVADMDGDGVLDVVVTSHDRTVTVLSGRGRVRERAKETDF